MKLNKFFLIIQLLGIILWNSMGLSVFAVDWFPSDAVNMAVLGSNKYIFIDNPEKIGLQTYKNKKMTENNFKKISGVGNSNIIGGYTYLQKLAPNQTYDIELYSSNACSKDLVFGIALCNASSKPIQGADAIVIKNAGTGISVRDKSNGNSSGADAGAAAVLEYAKNQSQTHITIAPNDIAVVRASVLLKGSGINQKKELLHCIDMKLKISVPNIKTPLYLKTFYIEKDKYKSNFGSVTKETKNYIISAYPAPVFNKDGVGVCDSNNRTFTYDYAAEMNQNHAFYLNQYKSLAPQNINENMKIKLYNRNDVMDLYGNYGVTYTITIKNAQGKYIKITPQYFDYFDYVSNRRVIFVDCYKPLIRSIPPMESIILNDELTNPAIPNNNYTFQYTLPSGNVSNILFQIVDNQYD